MILAGRRLTQRGLQLALGVLWLVDGLLQAQPFMFGSGFPGQVLYPASFHQPGWVAAGVRRAAVLVAAQPALWNAVFVVVQLALGAGLLFRPLARTALAASIAWSLAVWYFGEGLGGLASGHASLLTGAPGAVLLYALLAALALPRSTKDNALASWTPVVWAVVWAGGAVFQALPGQHDADGVADSLNSRMVGWLNPLGTAVADGVRAVGVASVVIVLVSFVGIGLGGLVPGRPRKAAGWAGIVLALVIWVLGEGFGMLTSGQATDPGSGPLLILLAAALLSLRPAQETELAWRVPTPVLSGVSALAVAAVALVWWATSPSVAPGPAPGLTVSTVYTPAGNGTTAPVYLTITNNGGGADTLESAGTEFQTASTAKSVTVCADANCAQPGSVTIPAHSAMVFDAHGPQLRVSGMGALAVGHPPLQLTLAFARSGVLHVLSPIGSAANLTERDVMTYGFMGHASPGMGMDEDMTTTPETTMPATNMPGMTMPGG